MSHAGASSGLGLETTRVLALRGVNIVMAVRNVDAGERAKRSIINDVGDVNIQVMEVDVSSLHSVHKFCATFKSAGTPLNILMYVHKCLFKMNEGFFKGKHQNIPNVLAFIYIMYSLTLQELHVLQSFMLVYVERLWLF